MKTIKNISSSLSNEMFNLRQILVTDGSNTLTASYFDFIQFLVKPTNRSVLADIKMYRCLQYHIKFERCYSNIIQL